METPSVLSGICMGKDDLGFKLYVLSNKYFQFYRCCDSTFRYKYTGFWYLEDKYFDYFATKVGDFWMNWENIKSFFYVFNYAQHIYEVGSEELLFSPNRDLFLIKITSNLDSHIYIEFGFCIRNKLEGYIDSKISVKQISEDSFVIEREGYKPLYIKFSEKVSLINSYYRDNYQEDFKSKVLVCFFKTNEKCKELIVCLSTSKSILEDNVNSELFSSEYAKNISWIEETIKKYKKISFGDPKLDLAFEIAIMNLEMLKKVDGFFFAGLPWFTETWTRDLMWILLAYLNLGDFETVRRYLNFYLFIDKYLQDGKEIPNYISPKGRISYDHMDGYVLLLIVLERFLIGKSKDILFRFFGHKVYIEKLEELIKLILEKFDKDGDFMLETDETPRSKTWMDSIKRVGKPIEVNALWLYALELYFKIMKIYGKTPSLKVNVEELKGKFYKTFYNYTEKSLVDLDRSNLVTANVLIPIIFGIVDYWTSLSTLKKVDSVLRINGGISVWDKRDVRYSPEGYHRGSMWIMCNFWYLTAKSVIGLKDYELLYRILEFVKEKYALYSFPENVSSSSKELIGCVLQGWSAAWFIIYVTEFLIPKIRKESYSLVVIDTNELKPFNYVEDSREFPFKLII